MKETIERYRKLIWGWTAVNTVMLLVNLFDLKLEVTDYVNILTSKGSDGFWPFVKFIEHHDFYNLTGVHDNDYTSFNGIFYQYNYPEFIVYMLLLFGFLTYKAYVEKK